jgi:Phosphodiester glycosidase
LLLVSPGQEFTLDELADQLAASDLSIQNALNLDGGSSTGLYVAGSSQVSIDPLLMIPIVIVVK